MSIKEEFYVIESQGYREDYSSNYAYIETYKVYKFNFKKQAEGFVLEGKMFNNEFDHSYYNLLTKEEILEKLDNSSNSLIEAYENLKDMSNEDYSDYFYDEDNEQLKIKR
jgi:hypothetical protein